MWQAGGREADVNKSRLLRTLAGSAMFLIGYSMQGRDIEPFAGFEDPRVLGLALEGLGLLLLLSSFFARPRDFAPRAPFRLRRELLRKPPGLDPEEESPPAAAPRDPVAPDRPDEPQDSLKGE